MKKVQNGGRQVLKFEPAKSDTSAFYFTVRFGTLELDKQQRSQAHTLPEDVLRETGQVPSPASGSGHIELRLPQGTKCSARLCRLLLFAEAGTA